jgi:hypothetical protein
VYSRLASSRSEAGTLEAKLFWRESIWNEAISLYLKRNGSPGADPTTSESTTTTPALWQAGAFLEAEEDVFGFQNALGYSWRCKF